MVSNQDFVTILLESIAFKLKGFLIFMNFSGLRFLFIVPSLFFLLHINLVILFCFERVSSWVTGQEKKVVRENFEIYGGPLYHKKLQVCSTNV